MTSLPRPPSGSIPLTPRERRSSTSRVLRSGGGIVLGSHPEDSELPPRRTTGDRNRKVSLAHPSTADSDRPPRTPGRTSFSLGSTALRSPKKAAAAYTSSRGGDSSATVGTQLVEQDLVSVPLFANCSAAFIAKVSSMAIVQTMKVAEELATAGQDGMSMILVQAGSVDVMVRGIRVKTLEKGESFGEELLLGLEDRWPATLQAKFLSTIAEIRREALWQAIEEFPAEAPFFESILERSVFLSDLSDLVGPAAELFRGLSPKLLSELGGALLPRLYFPNERILGENASGDNLHLLLNGRATVEILGRWVRDEVCGDPSASSPSSSSSRNRNSDPGRHVCFGEPAFLGLATAPSASATTITAQTICCARILSKEVLQQLLQEYGETLPAVSSLEDDPPDPTGRSPGDLLLKSGIFKKLGSSPAFVAFLGTHLEERLYFKGQIIVSDAESEHRSLVILDRGRAEGHTRPAPPPQPQGGGSELSSPRTPARVPATVTSFSCGAIFGEVATFGIVGDRSCSVVTAAGCCICHVLHQSVIVRGLELFPDERDRLIDRVIRGRTPGAPHVHMDYDRDKKQDFIKMLQATAPFADLEPGLIDELSAGAVDRLYMPQELIIREGQTGDSMFIMLSGTAVVFVQADPQSQKSVAGARRARNTLQQKEIEEVQLRQSSPNTAEMRNGTKVGALQPGGVCGELAMLGVSQVRSASIEAASICLMWEISQDRALPVLERYPLAKKRFQGLIIEHLERTVPARLLSLPLFQGFDKKFRMLLALYCERRVYFPGQQITRQGAVGERLFIINLGRAILEKRGESVRTFSAGSHFGSGAMLQVSKTYIGTLVALQTCHVLAVSHSAYLQALERYPSQSAAQQLRRQEKNATEEMVEQINRTVLRKMLWRRYHAAGPNDKVSATLQGSAQPIRSVFDAWRNQARRLVEARRWHETERGAREEAIQKWVHKQQSARERARTKGDEAALTNKGAFRPAASSPREPRPQLPPIAAAAAAGAIKELAKLRDEWPAPHPSPHYQLSFWRVLSQTASADPGLLLPLISAAAACRKETQVPLPTIRAAPPMPALAATAHWPALGPIA